jgi:hypothetical protein
VARRLEHNLCADIKVVEGAPVTRPDFEQVHSYNSRGCECGCNSALLGDRKAEDLLAALDRVLALHVADEKNLCDECFQDWPCETVRALDAV